MADRRVEIDIVAEDHASSVMDGIGGSADGVAGSVGKLGSLAKGAAAGAGLAIGAALMKGIGDAIDATDTQARLEVKLGATGERAGELGDLAGQLYADNFGESLGDVSNALVAVERDLGDFADTAAGGVEGMTQKVLTLSDVFEQDLGQATRAVSQMLRTGLASSADEALDLLTVGFQSGADKAGDLLDTVTEYSTQFRNAGLSGEQALGLISQGLADGARDADIVADAIKEFTIRAVDGSKLTADGFKMIGLNAGQMASDIGAGGDRANAALDLTLDRLSEIEDPVLRSQAAVALFGTQAEDLGQALFALDPSSAVDALGQVGGAAQKAVDTMGDTPAAKIESFKRKFTQAFTEMGGAAITFAEQVPGAVRSAAAEMDITAQDLTAFTDDIRTQIVPAFRDDLLPAMQAFGEAVRPIAGFIGETLGPVVTGTFEHIVDVIKGALEAITGLLNVFSGILTGDWSKMWDGLGQIASGGKTVLVSLGEQTVTKITAVFKLGAGTVTGIFRTMNDGAVSAVRGLPGQLASLGSSAVTQFTGALRTGVAAARIVATSIGSSITGAARAIPGQMASIGGQIVSGLVSGIRNAAGAVYDAAARVVASIPAAIRRLMGISSPSRVTRELGANIMSSLGLGMDDERAGVEAAWESVTLRPPVASVTRLAGRYGGGSPAPTVLVNVTAGAVGNEQYLARVITEALDRANIRGYAIGAPGGLRMTAGAA